MTKKKLFLVVLAAFTSSVAFAQNIYPVSTYLNATTFNPGVVTPRNVPAAAFAVATGGLIEINTKGTFPTSSGSVPVDLKSPIPKSAATTALGNFARKALPIASTGFAIWELAEELGFFRDTSGPQPELKRISEDPYATDQSYYDGFENQGSLAGGWKKSGIAACNDYLAENISSSQYGISGVTYTAPSACSAMLQSLSRPQDPPGKFNFSVSVRSAPPPLPFEPEIVPATIEELIAEIASSSGWPSGSSAPDALKEAITSGEEVSVPAPTVSGPSTSPGPTTVTNDVTNNTTTTNTTTNNHTYNNNVVTTTQTTTSTTTNNTTNQIINQTTTTTQPNNSPSSPSGDTEKPEPFEMPCGISGKSPCNVKVDETGVNSDSSTVFDSAKSKIDEAEQAAKDALAEGGPARSIQAPQWSWTFQLPAGCSPYPLEPFGMSVDVCAFQDTIHDLMSLLWVGAGLFGLLGLLRSAFGE